LLHITAGQPVKNASLCSPQGIYLRRTVVQECACTHGCRRWFLPFKKHQYLKAKFHGKYS